jgi:type VI secretion system protein ImpE
LEPPEDLRDLIWAKAVFTWSNGGQLPALIPVRYPGSESSQDPKVQMAATTLWAKGAALESNDQAQLGLGQRLFATDQEDIPILQIQKIQFQGVTSEADQAPSA